MTPRKPVEAGGGPAENDHVSFRRAMVRIIRLGGISRHGLIASSRWVARTAPRPSTALRVAWVIPASLLIGLGVALVIAAELGVPPYDVLLSGITRHLDVSHGQAAWLTSAALMLLATVLGVRPKLVGIVYVLSVGLAIDASLQIISHPEALHVRIVMAASGLALLATGIAVIVHTQATGGAMELLMQAGEQRGLSPVRVRTGLEITTFGVGLSVGGMKRPR